MEFLWAQLRRYIVDFAFYTFQNVLFYVISDDIKAAKSALRHVNQERNYTMVFPVAKSYGIKAHAPGRINRNTPL